MGRIYCCPKCGKNVNTVTGPSGTVSLEICPDEDGCGWKRYLGDR